MNLARCTIGCGTPVEVLHLAEHCDCRLDLDTVQMLVGVALVRKHENLRIDHI
jgi:hypothetical protein